MALLFLSFLAFAPKLSLVFPQRTGAGNTYNVQETPTKVWLGMENAFLSKTTLNLLLVDIFCIFKNAKKGHIKISSEMENAFLVQEIPIVPDKK
jgi:hypothetical protein